ncbi:MAG: hypothetical protein QOJ97_2522, partial [Solirubrobacteraceae bacterium]|nr:hypothetical protein [Solirubrobacteraceae bacterium]
LDKLRDGMSELGYEPAQTRTDRLSMSERLRTSPVLRRRRSILWGLRRARAAQR